MKNLFKNFTLMGSLFLMTLFSAPVVFADGPTPGSVGARGIGSVPREDGITPPYTMIGGGRYRDGNGTTVVLTGPDGNERFEYENDADRDAYEESQDDDWQKNHKGKFPGTYREWKDLQKFKEGNLDGGLDGYDFGSQAGVDTTGLSQIDDQHASADMGDKGHYGY